MTLRGSPPDRALLYARQAPSGSLIPLSSGGSAHSSPVLVWCTRATERVASDEAAMQRAIDLRLHGLRDLDALPLACAERSGVEALVTTDDAFISAARRLTPASSVRVVNPVVYALEVLQ